MQTLLNDMAPKEAFQELTHLVARLRGEGGCPWDRRQTPESMKKYLREESKELLQAITSGDSEAVLEELGDLLFIVVFLARLYEEQGAFNLAAVCAGIHAKMVRRHPHVFAGQEAGSDEEQIRRWAAIKAEERRKKGR